MDYIYTKTRAYVGRSPLLFYRVLAGLFCFGYTCCTDGETCTILGNYFPPGESTQHKSGPLVGRSVVSFVALLDDDGELEWKVGTAFSNVKWQWRQPAARVEDVRSYEVES